MSNIIERTDSYQKIDWSRIKHAQEQYKITLRQNKRLASLLKKRIRPSVSSFAAFENDTNFINYISDNLKTNYSQLTTQSNLQKFETLKILLSHPDVLIVNEVLLSLKSILHASSLYIPPFLSSGIPSILLKYLNISFPKNLVETSA